jgi:hypothetical protein
VSHLAICLFLTDCLVAKSYLELEGNPTFEQRQKLLKLQPKFGVLGLLDKILDYLEFEELERVILVSKIFFYAATQEKLYIKFDLHSISSTLSFQDEDVDKIMKKIKEKRSHKSIVSAVSTKIRSDSRACT